LEGERSVELFITEDSIVEEDEIDIKLLESCSTQLLTLAEYKEGVFSAGIKVCDTALMKEMHGFYMNDESETDVLAFPSDEKGGYLGDIIVCKDVAVKCANEFKNEIKAELHFYCLHGLLHLLGYEDSTEELKQEMLSLQKQALSTQGVNINI
jgi:probable rRNA maturation factor